MPWEPSRHRRNKFCGHSRSDSRCTCRSEHKIQIRIRKTDRPEARTKSPPTARSSARASSPMDTHRTSQQVGRHRADGDQIQHRASAAESILRSVRKQDELTLHPQPSCALCAVSAALSSVISCLLTVITNTSFRWRKVHRRDNGSGLGQVVAVLPAPRLHSR